MRLTNTMNLPQPLYDAIAGDDYNRGDSDISVTQLIDPPRKVALTEFHKNEIVEDASDRLWALYGKLVHKILEEANTTGIAEQRLFMKVGGWTLSGQTDRLELMAGHGFRTHLRDWKFVTAWKAKGKTPPEYVQQLNCYAELLRQAGYEVEKLSVVAILRDWSKLEAKRSPDYPQKQVAYLDVPLWPRAVAQHFINERVAMHQSARKQLPHCTPEERWARPDKWAVMRPSRVKALRLLDSHQEAIEWASESKHDGIAIVHRPGESIRCAHYCVAAPFCTQRQEEMKEHV